ncbi:site-specific integrase [Kribbella qitaiheensis]|uniref:Site-specific integrase n=1 Tax=Kribbella qitaiheensis TaxID=1544730 RepID=A0A7G6WVR4_9ACTN|nr:tyrosine-type recombinase/integrase [Kribbella qitaiheensis]QNE18079.1 site-specific integrase [Kribbella qitaiheensis]
MTGVRRRAATTRLEPGEHSIDRNTPTPRILKGREVVVLDWSIRLLSGRLLEDKRTQGRTVTEVRRKAKVTAKRLLDSEGGGSQWKATDSIERYLDEVASQEILNASLRPDTRRQYQRLLKLLRAQLAGHSIATAEVPDVLVTAIQRIAAENGHEAGRQAQHFHGKYVAQPLRRHKLLTQDPIEGMSLNLRVHAPELTGPKRGGVALTAAEQERVLVSLLELDPGEGVPQRQRGRWSYETRKTKQLCAIDLTILQIGTGLRLKEALSLRWADVFYDEDGVMRIKVSKDVSKTGIARESAVLDSRVQKRLEARWARARSDEEFVIGAPADPTKQWGKTGNGGASQILAELYKKVAKQARAVHMDFQRTHLWRTTLNRRLKEAGVSQADRAAQFGHDVETNEASYTDNTDIRAVAAAYRQRHNPDLKSTGKATV